MRKKHIHTLIRGLVSLGMLGWLAFLIDWRSLADAIYHIRWAWMIPAIGWIILSVVISVTKWRIILQAQEIKLAWSELWNAYWAGLFFNNFLPSSIGGDALRIFWAGKLTGDIAGSTASVFVERVLATIGLSLTGLAASFFILQTDKLIISLFTILILLGLVLLGLLIWGKVPQRFAQSQGRIVAFLKGLESHGTRLKGKYRMILLVVLFSVLFQACVVGVNYSIFKALHITSIAWIDALYIIPVTSVAAMLPVGINGYGVREGAYVALLADYHVLSGTAFAASILFAFMVSLTSLYGAWTWLAHFPGRRVLHAGGPSRQNSAGTNEKRL